MPERMNAGFKIIVSVPMNDETEIVIGYKLTTLGDQYVCWFCSDSKNYYWGNYCHTYTDALKFLTKRLSEYLGVRYA